MARVVGSRVLVVDVLCIFAIAGLLTHRYWDSRKLATFVRTIHLWPDQRQTALEVAAACSRIPFAKFEPVLIHALPVFGAGPGALLRSGGCCAGHSRVLILALERIGIPAFQVTLYHVEGYAQHCLVQAWVGEEPLLMDPSYGLYFASPGGQPVGIRELQAGVKPVFRPLPGSSATGYPRKPYYDFDFKSTRTANWTRTAPRRLAYSTLRLILGRGADQLEVPATMEWPQHLAIAAVLLVLAAAHLCVELTSWIAT